MKRLCVTGIGNPIMGDDGVGIAAVKKLQSSMSADKNISFLFLYSDLFEMADHLCEADRFIFVDAIAGKEAGRVVRFNGPAPALAPSNHQTDIATVMQMLQNIDLIRPFPAWELWGVTVRLPLALGEGLSKEAAAGVNLVVNELTEKIEKSLA